MSHMDDNRQVQADTENKERTNKTTVDRLTVPDINLRFAMDERGNLTVSLPLSPGPNGQTSNVPFYEATRSEQISLLNSAQAHLLGAISTQGSGLQIRSMSTEANGSFTLQIGNVLNVSGSARGSAEITNNRSVQTIIESTERSFDQHRESIYRARAQDWSANGARVPHPTDANAEFKVTAQAARDYVQRGLNFGPRADEGKTPDDPKQKETYPPSTQDQLKPTSTAQPTPITLERASIASEQQTSSATTSQSVALAPGNDQLNRQFEQALKGANGDRDAAAIAVATISNMQGYKPNEDISIIQGSRGLIVSQGAGDASLNALVPPAKPGDFERVATQFAQTPQTQQVAIQPEQQERRMQM
jgi:hypothetical protein